MRACARACYERNEEKSPAFSNIFGAVEIFRGIESPKFVLQILRTNFASRAFKPGKTTRCFGRSNALFFLTRSVASQNEKRKVVSRVVKSGHLFACERNAMKGGAFRIIIENETDFTCFIRHSLPKRAENGGSSVLHSTMLRVNSLALVQDDGFCLDWSTTRKDC